MSCDIEAARPDGPLFRVGRHPDAWEWPDWAHARTNGTFGGRYDDPRGEYRVLYASSERVGAFLEVLAPLRPDPAVVAELEQIDGDEDSSPATLTLTWLDRRAIGTANATIRTWRASTVVWPTSRRGYRAPPRDRARIRSRPGPGPVGTAVVRRRARGEDASGV